jgi:hypothetical protein
VSDDLVGLVTSTAPQVLACPHCGQARVVTTQSYVLFNKSAADPNGPIHPATTGTMAHVYSCASCRGFLFWYGGQVVPLPSAPVVIEGGQEAVEFVTLFLRLTERLSEASQLANAARALLEGAGGH